MPKTGFTASLLLAATLVAPASCVFAQLARPESRTGLSPGSRSTAPAAPTTPPVAAAPAPAPAAATATANGAVETIGPTSRVSSGVAAAITAGLPKYQVPKPAEPAAPRPRDPGEMEADDGEALPEATPIAADQPKNKIIRLPKYVVEADRPPIFKEREILTKRALAELAVRRYLSRFDSKVLNRFTLPIIGQSPEARAMAMYEEDVRLENISELKDAAAAARRGGDKAGSDYILRETNNTFLRSGGMDWTSRRND